MKHFSCDCYFGCTELVNKLI